MEVALPCLARIRGLGVGRLIGAAGKVDGQPGTPALEGAVDAVPVSFDLQLRGRTVLGAALTEIVQIVGL